jgi:hypothetical protein
MKLSRKLGLITLIITEVIILIAFTIVVFKIIKSDGQLSDLLSIIYAQTGVLGMVWIPQGAVNYAKNRQPKQIFNGFKHEE